MVCVCLRMGCAPEMVYNFEYRKNEVLYTIKFGVYPAFRQTHLFLHSWLCPDYMFFARHPGQLAPAHGLETALRA